MVQATLYLIEEALKSTRSYNYFFLISESCFPIKTPAQISSILSGGGEFISVEKQVDIEHPKCLHDTYASQYYQNDFFFLNSKFEAKDKNHYLLRRLSLAFLLRINRYSKPRRYPGNFPIYRGSQWWCLSGEAIKYLLRFLKENGKTIRFFRYTHCPDEMFFQTILMNSNFRKKVLPKDANHDCGSHYIEWVSTKGRQPKVLTEKDYNNIINSKAMFTRKMESKVSQSLIEKLEKYF